MASVIGVVRRAQHPRLLVEDTRSAVIAPQTRLLQCCNHIVEPADDKERWIVIGDLMYGALISQVSVLRCWLECERGRYMRIALARRTFRPSRRPAMSYTT